MTPKISLPHPNYYWHTKLNIRKTLRQRDGSLENITQMKLQAFSVSYCISNHFHFHWCISLYSNTIDFILCFLFYTNQNIQLKQCIFSFSHFLRIPTKHFILCSSCYAMQPMQVHCLHTEQQTYRRTLSCIELLLQLKTKTLLYPKNLL